MRKIVNIKIGGRSYPIHTGEDEKYLQKIAAQFDVLLTDAARHAPKASTLEHLVMVGLEQQDQLCCLKKQVNDLQDSLDHYNLGEGLGCVADYRETIAILNQKIDAQQHEIDTLRRQLKQTFATLTKLTANHPQGKE